MIDWNTAFPLGSVSRIDIKEAGFTEEQILQLTDADMREIASEMEDWYCDNGFWIDLEIVVRDLLDKKTRPLGEETHGE